MNRRTLQPFRPFARITSMRKIITAAVVGLSTTALTLGLAGTAHAEQYEVDDPNDTSHGSDIVSLQVRNSAQDIYVRSYHDDLSEDPASGSGGAIFFDTDKSTIRERCGDAAISSITAAAAVSFKRRIGARS